MIEAPPPGDYVEFEVDIIREAWNTYDLEDGTRIRARSVLAKVFWLKGVQPKEGEPTQIQLGGDIKNLVSVFAPPRLRREPNPNPPSVEAALKMKQEEVRIVDSKEEWSVYRFVRAPFEPKATLPPFGLKVKMVATSVRRVLDMYDKHGDPYYLLDSTTVVSPTTPRELESP